MMMPQWTLALALVFVQRAEALSRQVIASPGRIFSDDFNSATRATTSTTAAATMEGIKQESYINASKYFDKVKEEEKKGKEVVALTVVNNGARNEAQNTTIATLENMPEEFKSRMAAIDNVYRSTMVPCMSQVTLLLDRYYYISPEGRSLCYWAMTANPRSSSRLRLSCSGVGQGMMFRHGIYIPYDPYYNDPNCYYGYNGPIVEVYSHSWLRPRRYCQSNRPFSLDSHFNWMVVVYTNEGRWRDNHMGFNCSVVAYDVRRGPFPTTRSPTTTRFPTTFSTISTLSPPTPTASPFRCNCGRVRTTASQTAGNNETMVNKYPWMVGLTFAATGEITIFCTGALINERWVLTSARCIQLADTREFYVALGEHDVSTSDEANKTEFIKALRTIIHPDFNYDDQVGDIGLVQLSEAPDTTSPSAVIGPICLLQSPLDSVTNIPAIIAGWGETGFALTTLQEENVSLYLYEDCKTEFTFTEQEPLPNDTICFSTSNKDECSGHSGGPVFARANNGLMFLFGITSYGPSPCAYASAEVGVSTRVSEYLDWIKSQVNEIPVCYPSS